MGAVGSGNWAAAAREAAGEQYHKHCSASCLPEACASKNGAPHDQQARLAKGGLWQNADMTAGVNRPWRWTRPIEKKFVRGDGREAGNERPRAAAAEAREVKGNPPLSRCVHHPASVATSPRTLKRAVAGAAARQAIPQHLQAMLEERWSVAADNGYIHSPPPPQAIARAYCFGFRSSRLLQKDRNALVGCAAPGWPL